MVVGHGVTADVIADVVVFGFAVDDDLTVVV